VKELGEVPEERLQRGEAQPADHHHDDVALAEEAMEEHLVSDHRVDVPEGLSLGTLEGMHDRFHGEAHAIDD
jgi:hypothetical protein